MNHLFKRLRLISSISLLGLAVSASPVFAEEAEAKEPSNGVVQLPGVKVDANNLLVDIDAEVALSDGLLELIACTRGTREHESVVVTDAHPVHIHSGLLLLGARNGNPVMQKPIDEAKTRWRFIPPRGAPIKVFLVFEDEEGKTVERPISDFIKRSEGDPYMPNAGYNDERAPEGEEEKFSDIFLFAGSQIITNSKDERVYLAAESGNIITISSFGDEILCMPDIQSRENGELVWEVDSTHLPPVESKVTLRLRPMFKEPEPEVEEADQKAAE